MSHQEVRELGKIYVTCPKCGYSFEMYDDECTACPNCGFVVCGPYANSGGSEGCFITTAVVKAAGLPDDAYELEILRRFRDEYLKKTEWGKRLVEEYYNISPKIVDAIEKDPAKQEVYSHLLQEIRDIVKDIEKGEYSLAVEKYKNMVLHLKDRYKVA